VMCGWIVAKIWLSGKGPKAQRGPTKPKASVSQTVPFSK
jgi:hypothetical protein